MNQKIKPILFSTPMVEAIMNGTKTQTRRVIDVPSNYHFAGYVIGDAVKNGSLGFSKNKDLRVDTLVKPKYEVGDILWVRETWQYIDFAGDDNGYVYKASENGKEWQNNSEEWKWKPSIFMPKEACRNFLKVTNITFEHLNDISESDAIKEGIIEYDDGTFKNYFKQKGLRAIDGVECLLAKGSYQSLWESINGKGSWDANPYVWVIKFERTERPNEFC